MSDINYKYEHSYEKTRAEKLSKIAGDYRQDYLTLRKMIREFMRANQDVEFPKELIKAVGMK